MDIFVYILFKINQLLWYSSCDWLCLLFKKNYPTIVSVSLYHFTVTHVKMFTKLLFVIIIVNNYQIWFVSLTANNQLFIIKYYIFINPILNLLI